MDAKEIGEGIIELAGDAAAVASGPLAPVMYGAKELLKYGYGFLVDEHEKKGRYKVGNWYENPDYDEDLFYKGGPSNKFVPLSPSVDPASWTPAGRARWEKANKLADGGDESGEIAPAPIVGPPRLSNLSYGWHEHYAPQIPLLKINTSRGKVRLHPPKGINPNATMVPSGGFSKYNK